jgi:CubicO group peptidase (beta-lactamase class C family)
VRAPPLLLSAALLVAAAAHAQGPGIQEELTHIVVEEHAKSDTPGIVVAVANSDGPFAGAAVGVADIETGIPVTLDTVFAAASVSKLLTATLVMRQVDHGRLALDATANSYLPPERWIRNESGEPVDATLRQLLTHTSGLPVSFLRGWADPGDPILSLDAFLANGLVATRPPGEKIVYSNEGFALLGSLAAGAEDESFGDHARRVLFEPLGMTSSDFYPRADLDARLAASHGGLFFQEGRAEHPDVTAMAPAASLRTTVGDLLKFGRMFLKHGIFDETRVLKTNTVGDMWALQQASTPDETEGFGLGFGVVKHPGRYRVWWDGGLPGVAARLLILPEHDLALAVLSNRADPGLVNVISTRLLNLITGPYIDRPYLAKEEDLERVVGYYRITDFMDPKLWFVEPFVAVRVERSGEGLSLSLQGPGAYLRPLGPDRYRIEGGPLDGLSAVFSGDQLTAAFFVSERIGAWQSPLALLSYLGVFGLLLLGGAAYGVYRLVRRLRAA